MPRATSKLRFGATMLVILGLISAIATLLSHHRNSDNAAYLFATAGMDSFTGLFLLGYGWAIRRSANALAARSFVRGLGGLVLFIDACLLIPGVITFRFVSDWLSLALVIVLLDKALVIEWLRVAATIGRRGKAGTVDP